MSQDSTLAGGRLGRDPESRANVSEVVVSVQNITKYFGPLKVLDGVSLEVRQGQLVAIQFVPWYSTKGTLRGVM